MRGVPLHYVECKCVECRNSTVLLYVECGVECGVGTVVLRYYSAWSVAWSGVECGVERTVECKSAVVYSRYVAVFITRYEYIALFMSVSSSSCVSSSSPQDAPTRHVRTIA